MSESGSVGHGLKTAGREFVTIVAGVLFALATQAWWQGREDRSREREYLRQLLSDVEVNQERLENAIRGDSIGGQTLTRIGDALFSANPLPPSATIREWLLDDTWMRNSEFQPLTGTYTALISSGDLALIRTDSLRALLVAYSAHVVQAESQLRLYIDQSFGDINQLAAAFPFVSDLAYSPKSFMAPDYKALRRSAEAKGWFFALRVGNSNRLRTLRRLQQETDRLHAALELEATER